MDVDGKIPWHQIMQSSADEHSQLEINVLACTGTANEGPGELAWQASTERIDVSVWPRQWAPTEVKEAGTHEGRQV